MKAKPLRFLGYLMAVCLLASCQAKQYGFFQASSAIKYPAEQLPAGTASELVTEPTIEHAPLPVSDSVALKEDPVTALGEPSVDKPRTTNRLTEPSRSIQKADRKAYRKAIRAELRATMKQYRAKPAAGETNGLATASFITGLATLIFLFIPGISALTILLGPFALISGIISIGQINRRGQKGLGLGIVGTVLGGVYILLLLIAVAALSSVR